MGFDIHLEHPSGDPDSRVEVGNFPSEVLTIWNAAFLKYTNAQHSTFTQLHGKTAETANFLIPEMVALLIVSVGEFIHPSDYYQQAVLALVELWKCCREHPEYIVHINY